ncbi:MAG: general secretion pathway protein GspB [Arenimonas sp.]
MSLILDALKKSEAERQRGQVPNVLSPLSAAPSYAHAHKQSKLPWLILIAALLVMLVAAYFYTKSQAATPPGIVAAPANEISVQTTASVPAQIAMPIVEASKPVIVEKPTVQKTETKAPTPEISPPAIQATSIPDETDTMPRIASLSEMPSDQRQQLPTLKLSMHVYSAEAGKRFAIIDGQRVNEGSVLGSAVIEQIRQDGVVLSVQGQSYLLPRP